MALLFMALRHARFSIEQFSIEFARPILPVCAIDIFNFVCIDKRFPCFANDIALIVVVLTTS
jgi:hypothetical protein